jgi:hypothetical protein
VTKFTVQAYPMGQAWGGLRGYTSASQEALYAALADFVENNHKDTKAAIIFTAANALGSPFYTVFFCYDGPTPPKGAFGKFEDIKASFDTTKTTRYLDIVRLLCVTGALKSAKLVDRLQ